MAPEAFTDEREPQAAGQRDYPLRRIRTIMNEAPVVCVGAGVCDAVSPIGRPSIPREKLLLAMLLQAFFSLLDPLGAAFYGAAGV
ncbi:hypothetical protein GFM07_38955 [Rhizobium leguminosarum bv. viciae]|nr:transposase [Rhizobium leguminosarum]NKL24840.1 hypothetical protein [Rhizobium leguminosarum bv. viciae]NKL60072.1 hypothetical protein [Rhizobium leguminosarum bv. viciae]